MVQRTMSIHCRGREATVNEPTIRVRFSDLPLEIAFLILKYVAQPTLCQKERYTDKNPYSSALSLCLVSRLVRHIALPEFLHTVLLRQSHSLKAFANALRMQKAYAKKESDLFFDYTSVVQRIWIKDHNVTEQILQDSKLKPIMSVLVPVLLAAPALAIDCCHLKVVVQCMEDAWTSRAGPGVDHRRSPFPGKTQSLTIVGQSTEKEIFEPIQKGSGFLASIPRLTYLVDMGNDGDKFRDISRGSMSPEGPLKVWMSDIPWACMKSLETFSVAYPHLDAIYNIYVYGNEAKGLNVHVERLTVSASLFRQDPESFPWVTPPFPVTGPGEKRIRSDGVCFEVTRGQALFWQFLYPWDKVWACGLTD
ncbi:hypothetical protein BDR05DRAFT_705090 [Suillus weaverae]|nr:hypothetical protein BDR05DRAFT_705090 [Suillus weaverae]